MTQFLEEARAIYEGRASFGHGRGTASDHYRRFAKMGVEGYSLEEADKPAYDAISEEFDHLMVWYADIRNRQSRGQRFEPIELQAILAYEHFLAKSGIAMSAFDWDIIFRLDHLWMKAVPKTDAEVAAENKQATRQTRH